MKLVEVKWVDTISSDHGWQPPGEYIRRVQGTMRDMKTAGYLVSTKKGLVVVAHSTMVGNGQIDRVISIPRTQVRSIRRLR